MIITLFLSSTIPTAVILTFACPCFPGLETCKSVTLHAAPSITTVLPFFNELTETGFVDILFLPLLYL